jgi:hypothetical protein
MSTTVSDSVARPVRTGGQVLSSGVVTEFIDAFIYDMNDRQYLALAAVLVVVLSWAQVLVEDRLNKGLFRKVPQPEQPVVDNKDDGVA